MRFFPFVFSLFMFILVANLWGMFPYFFTVTSHIIVTATMALAVILSGGRLRLLEAHRLHFFKLFVPSGVPVVLLPFITVDRGALLHLAADLACRSVFSPTCSPATSR